MNALWHLIPLTTRTVPCGRSKDEPRERTSGHWWAVPSQHMKLAQTQSRRAVSIPENGPDLSGELSPLPTVAPKDAPSESSRSPLCVDAAFPAADGLRLIPLKLLKCKEQILKNVEPKEKKNHHGINEDGKSSSMAGSLWCSPWQSCPR